MRLRRAFIECFKGIRELEIEFVRNGAIQPLTALLGDNGSGKTTALQAIALTLSMATRRTPRIEYFNWHGFLQEMSSGEQAVFPLVYEFVRLEVRRSIVLIDELELHLHPPEQQRLLAALPRIGPDCQFIITTHSEYLSSAIPNEHEVRLERGTRCL